MRKLLVSLMLVTVAAFATPAAWGGQGQDFSKVQIKATKVPGDIYMLEGAITVLGESRHNRGARAPRHPGYLRYGFRRLAEAPRA